MSDIAVVDVDHGLKSREEFEQWREKSSLPKTYAVRTGRRVNGKTGEQEFGAQLYYKGSIPSCSFRLNGVSGEVKATGGYVMGVGSIHPISGERYETLYDVPLTPTPEIVKSLKHKTASQPKETATASGGLISAGGRNAAWTSLAGTLRNRGLSESATHGALISYAENDFVDGKNYVAENDEKAKDIAHRAVTVFEKQSESQDYVKGGFEPLPPMTWREEFKTSEQMSDEPVKMLIQEVIPEECSTFIAGLSGHGKTLIALSIARAFIYKQPLFGYAPFKVTEQLPVLYLVPESGEKAFKLRLKAFHLTNAEIKAETGRDDMFLCRTFSQGEMLQLDDERLLQAVNGRVVVLDTAIRFSDSDDENSAAQNKWMSDCIFRMLKRGARTVIGIHHSPKSFETAAYMCLENVMRGSGDLGAMLGACFGARMLDDQTTRVQVECVKKRDFNAPLPFQITGRPHIDATGDFKMTSNPGPTPYVGDVLKTLKGLKSPNKKVKQLSQQESNYFDACQMFENGASLNDVVEKLHVGKQTAQAFKDKYLAEKDGCFASKIAEGGQ